MTTTLELLSGIDALSALDATMLQELADACTRRDVARGETLIHEGAQADVLFVVLRGRFVVLKGDLPIAEIGPGEPIGELAFFAGGHRTASVVAARDGTVLAISRASYDDVSRRMPELNAGILVALSRRLAKTVRATPALKPRVGQVCAVVAGNGSQLPPELVQALRQDYSGRPRQVVIDSHDPACDPEGGVAAIRRRMEQIEADATQVLLLVNDAATRPDVAEAAIALADTLVILREAHDDTALSPLEHRILSTLLPSNIQLALWRPAGHAIEHTAKWLEERHVALHHHLEAGNLASIERLGRFLRGEALGMVFSGGGAHGCAHLGALKAMLEQGIEPDFVGGTSIGASIAAAISIGYSPEGVLSVFEDIFLRRKAMSRFNLPRYSVLDHRLFDQTLIEGYRGIQAEDAAINFFAVATSLTTNEMVVLRRGPIWESVRASTSLPAIFPPFVTPQGHVWIDGALVDNAPVEVMRRLKPGPNIVLNLTAQTPMTCELPYPEFPGRWDVLRSFFGRAKQATPPSLYAVLSNSMVINSRKRLEQIATEDDLFVAVSVPDGMSFLDWTRGREAFDQAYQIYAQGFAQSTGAHGFDRLDSMLRAGGV